MSIKNDVWIINQIVNNNLIEGGTVQNINKDAEGNKILSYGVTSYGYDLTLSNMGFQVYKYPGYNNSNLKIIDPLQFDSGLLKPVNDNHLAPFTKALGVVNEKINMPKNVVGLCVNKSTYARCGLIFNTTVIQPGWSGYLTLEFFNATPHYLKLHPNQGICHVMFFEGENSITTYVGQYQNQIKEVTLPVCK